ncbi:MAG: phosphate ABC transporter permease subunit PstC [Negativicutes bacterium]|jgi:phosphate transport system permease protein
MLIKTDLVTPATKRRNFAEQSAKVCFLACALTAFASLLVIIAFLLIKGLPAIGKIGLWDFLTGSDWNPSNNLFGILPMIAATLLSSAGALIISVVIGVLTAVYLAELANAAVARWLRFAIELLAGIPSVVFGFFGLIIIVPFIDRIAGGGGNSLLAAIIILSMMILPTIVSISEVSLRAVPREYKEGSLALGATRIQTIFRVLLPAAGSGVAAAVMLGLGRAIGETMAVILVSGNSPIMPGSIFDRVRTMTANIALEMGYASGLQQEALFATGVVLFVFIMIINGAVTALAARSGVKQ